MLSKLARFLSIALSAISLVACATPPPVKVATRAEIVEHDNAVGTELATRFESQVQLKNDREVAVYLRKVAQRLSDSSPDLKPSSVGVLILKGDRSGAWKNFGVPGNRVYLSVGLIRQFEFENEVAALIAFELAHIQKRHLMVHLMAPQGPLDRTEFSSVSGIGGGEKSSRAIDFFGPSGVFLFTEEEELEAADVAVDLLYRAGYDPRGLIGVWNTYASFPGRSPYETSTLQKLLERTRRSILGYAPLLNPIVRSAGFIAIQKRIRKL